MRKSSTHTEREEEPPMVGSSEGGEALEILTTLREEEQHPTPRERKSRQQREGVHLVLIQA